MLLLDGQPHKPTDKELNWDRKKNAPIDPDQPYFDPNNGAVFKLSKRHIHKNPLPRLVKNQGKKGRAISSPRSFMVGTEFVGTDEDGISTHWHWYQNKTQRRQGAVMMDLFVPIYITFKQNATMIVSDASLYYYMVNHPHSATSPFKKKGKKANFYFENLGKQSKEYQKQARLEMKAMGMLWGEGDSLLSPDQVIEMCQFYGINIDGRKTDEQYRQDLEKHAKDNPKQFIKVLDNPKAQCIGHIRQARDRGIIVYVGATRTWLYMNGEEMGDKIHTVRKTNAKEPIELLAEFLIEHDRKDHYSKIFDRLEKLDEVEEAVASED